MQIGELLREARRAAGLTQQYVADQFGISKTSVSEWENDKSRPDLAKLAQLARLYKTSVALLIEPSSTPLRLSPEQAARALADGLETPTKEADEEPDDFEPLQPDLVQAVEVLGAALLQLDDLGRQMAGPVLQALLANPASATAMGEQLQALVTMRVRPPPKPPSGPKPRTKKQTESARMSPTRAKLVLKIGGGDNPQRSLPLLTGVDAFDKRQISRSERDWYQHLKTVPKAADK